MKQSSPIFEKMKTNSPDSLQNVPSDDLSSLSSSSERLKAPNGKSQVEQELESLREKAVARNLRDKYAGSGSFMSPEEAMAYLSKQRKKTSNPPAPPSNLTSSAEISNWYMVQRQRELEERKKREEAEAYLRSYRGSAALFTDSPQQTQSPLLNTPVNAKDRKSFSTVSTPPTTNIASPQSQATPSPVQANKSTTASPSKSKPVDTNLPTQNSIAQLDAYLRSVRGATALQSKTSSVKQSETVLTSNTTSKSPDKTLVPSKTSTIKTETPSPTFISKVTNVKAAEKSPVNATSIQTHPKEALEPRSKMKPEKSRMVDDSTDKQTVLSNNSSSGNNPSDEDDRIRSSKAEATIKLFEHRETQVDQALIHRVRDSTASSPFHSVLKTPRDPKNKNMPENVDNTVGARLTAVPSQASLATSSLSGDSFTPMIEKKPSNMLLKVNTQLDEPLLSLNIDHPDYLDLLEDSVKKYVTNSVRNYQDLQTSLVTPHVAKHSSHIGGAFTDSPKDSSPKVNLISDSRTNQTIIQQYTPTHSANGPVSCPPIDTRLPEDIPRVRMKSPLQLLENESFQDDPLALLAQEADHEEDRFGSFESDTHMVGRNIWTVASDELDGNASVITSNSSASKSISQNTEFRMSSSSFQKLVQQQKEKYERRLKTRAEEHVEQIDDIIQQLNSIEVKYQSDLVNMRGSMSVKESNLVSLHALISQARLKNSQLTEDSAQQLAKFSAQKLENETVVKAQKELETAIQAVQNDIKTTLAQRERILADAIKRAQEEIKVEAERQFSQSNVAFIQVKRDLAAVEEDKKLWYKRAGEATSKLDGINADTNRRLEELTRQVNKTKEELEGSKTDLSRLKQQLVNERAAFTNRVESMTRDVSRLSKECSEAHQLAETINAEKDQLKREAEELKALSEELMSLVTHGG